MNDLHDPEITDRWIISQRGAKNSVDPLKPYAWLVEKERTITGEIKDTAIIFLTNRECPYHCLMCDLWKNTTGFTAKEGDIPSQIEWALGRMPAASQVKIYNSGSFFDERAIPRGDYKRIASLLNGFESVIVESHPHLVNEKCLEFRDMLKPDLQVAMGLETVNPDILRKLNKKMTLSDFSKAVKFLSGNDINSRAFILLKTPFMTEKEGIFWAERSIDFAFDSGTECCTVIPVRAGNGAMDELAKNGYFTPPSIGSLELVLEYGINLKKGRVFADTWDLQLFSHCDSCIEKRIDRLNKMNLSQEITERVDCSCTALQ